MTGWEVRGVLVAIRSSADMLKWAYAYPEAAKGHAAPSRVDAVRQTVADVSRLAEECDHLMSSIAPSRPPIKLPSIPTFRDIELSPTGEFRRRDTCEEETAPVVWPPSIPPPSADLARAIAKLGLDMIDICVVIETWSVLTDPTHPWPVLASFSRCVSKAEADEDLLLCRKAITRLHGERGWPVEIRKELCACMDDGLTGKQDARATAESMGERFGRVSAVALDLLWAAAEQLLCKWKRSAAEQAAWDRWDDSDKPQSDAEMKAKTLWQSGDIWLACGKRFGRGDGAVAGGQWAERVGAVVGHDRENHRKSVLLSDQRIFGMKRRSRVREFYQASGKGADYRNAWPDKSLHTIYNAVAFANRRGLVLNARVTVSWFMLADCDAIACKGLFQHFKRNLAQWLLDKGAPEVGQPWPAYVYAHETVGDAGFHTHMRLAVPSALGAEFRKEVRCALRRVIEPRPWPEPCRTKSGKRKVEFVVPRVSTVPEFDFPRPRSVTRDQWIGVGYMLKGVHPERVLATRDDGRPVDVSDVLEWDYQDPGTKWAGKQCGTSQALGEAAQRTFRDASGAPFRSRLDEQIETGKIDVRELYSDCYLEQAVGQVSAVVAPPAGAQPGSDDDDRWARLCDLLSRLAAWR